MNVMDAPHLLSPGEPGREILETIYLRKDSTDMTDIRIGTALATWTSPPVTRLLRAEHHKGPSLDLAQPTRTRTMADSTLR